MLEASLSPSYRGLTALLQMNAQAAQQPMNGVIAIGKIKAYAEEIIMNKKQAEYAWLFGKDVIITVRGKRIGTKIIDITAHGNCILEYKNKRAKPSEIIKGWKTYKEELREKVKAVPLKDKNVVLAVLKGEYKKEDGSSYAYGELSEHLGFELNVLMLIMSDIIKKSTHTYMSFPERLEK